MSFQTFSEPTSEPTLHMLCGKIAAGKSTLARQLGTAERTVTLSEDGWLAALYPGEIGSIPDYLRCSGRLQSVLVPHVAALLRAGLSVVLDFPANTVAQRAWMRDVLERSGAAHRMHLLDVPDAVCLERLRARNAAGTHPFAVTEEQFRRITAAFVPPSEDEVFTVVRHGV